MTRTTEIRRTETQRTSFTKLEKAWRGLLLAAAFCVPIALSSCAEAELGAHIAKSAIGGSGSGGFKVGKPYEIGGVWYYPKIDPNYDSTGIASWYGPKFHGRDTANGETFDQNALTAAHPTLPMPVLARVTNLENGRALVVRINDRGPSAHGREIDLSRRAAELLGFKSKGTAKVRVQYVGLAQSPDGQPYQVASASETFVAPKPVMSAEQRSSAAAAPVTSVASAPLAPPPGAATAPPAVGPAGPQPGAAVTGEVELVSVSGSNKLFVQAGSFRSQGNAETLRRQLAHLGNTGVTEAMVDGAPFYRVRVGPLADVQAADAYLERVIQQGHPGARIIVE